MRRLTSAGDGNVGCPRRVFAEVADGDEAGLTHLAAGNLVVNLSFPFSSSKASFVMEEEKEALQKIGPKYSRPSIAIEHMDPPRWHGIETNQHYDGLLKKSCEISVCTLSNCDVMPPWTVTMAWKCRCEHQMYV